MSRIKMFLIPRNHTETLLTLCLLQLLEMTRSNEFLLTCKEQAPLYWTLEVFLGSLLFQWDASFFKLSFCSAVSVRYGAINFKNMGSTLTLSLSPLSLSCLFSHIGTPSCTDTHARTNTYKLISECLTEWALFPLHMFVWFMEAR